MENNSSKGLNNEFEIAEVNEPSVFEPLKFYCNCFGKTTEVYTLFLKCIQYELLYHDYATFPLFSGVH